MSKNTKSTNNPKNNKTKKYNKTKMSYLKCGAYYSIAELMSFPQFRRFIKESNDVKGFKDNLLDFLRRKYSFYLEGGNQDLLDGISSIIKLIRNGHSISSDRYALLSNLIYEEIHKQNKEIEK